MNNELNGFLKKLEENHAKKFKNDKDYLESCKASKDLNPKDYKIQPNHKLDEYFNKYGKKLEKGNLSVYKKDELWLMNKNTKYWKIENDSDFIYFEVPSNLKLLCISLASLAAVAGITAGVYFGVFANKVKADDEGGGEVDPEPEPGDDIVEIRIKEGAVKFDDTSWAASSITSPAVRYMYFTFNNNLMISDYSQTINLDVTTEFVLNVSIAEDHQQSISTFNTRLVLSNFSDKYGNIDIDNVEYTCPMMISGTMYYENTTIDLTNYRIHEYLTIGSAIIYYTGN